MARLALEPLRRPESSFDWACRHLTQENLFLLLGQPIQHPEILRGLDFFLVERQGIFPTFVQQVSNRIADFEDRQRVHPITPPQYYSETVREGDRGGAGSVAPYVEPGS
jgi:hypothetical protein